MIFVPLLMLGWRSNMQLRHSLLYLLAHGIPALAAVLTLALYTRWISPEAYGSYSTLLVVANSANIILFNWLYVAIMRYWSDGEFKETDLSSIALVVLGIGSLLILGLALIYFVITGDAWVAASLAGLMISNAVYTMYQRINIVSLQAERYLLIELCRVLITTSLALSLVWLGYSWQGILIATSLGFLLVPLLSKQFWSYFWHYPNNLNYAKVLKLLKYGLPLSLTFMLLEVIHATDRVLLGWLVGLEVAGQYAVAFSLPFQLLILVGSAVNTAAYPLLLKTLEQQSEAVTRKKLANYFLILLGLLLPCYFGLIAISHDFMPLLIGATYLHESLRLLPSIGLLLVINVIYLFHTSLAFQIAKQTQKTVFIVGASAILNVVLNLILIPYYQIDGAILASLVAYSVCVFYGQIIGAKYFKLPIPWFELAKLVLAAVLMVIALNTLPLNHGLVEGMLRILLGAALYLGMIYLLDVGGIRVILVNFLKSLNKRNENTNYQS